MPLDEANRDRIEAAAFRRLLAHLRARDDVANVTLMGEAGFCRNCLADWLVEAAREAGVSLDRDEARLHVYGEPYEAFRARQPPATPEQLARMEASLAENRRRGTNAHG
ncbi:MAG: DUF1244 domain-containing protein [Sphingomonadaceae bacterium]|uniref:DUF1244 domain-containing protein n=1 Tax=Thermaurantiacus sp. TaxID=2820283 RepID=UPI00298EE9C1|nr:DUF1244 domain-containing protein [Thermaurantiacus sp.]MCS6987074.1 DUF1244 domain-containing protein [Sphingomonadaceae bacterium]MDW8415588.1 DUF1244 domain-containing protein [Thermaurantiacus sp.]